MQTDKLSLKITHQGLSLCRSYLRKIIQTVLTSAQIYLGHTIFLVLALVHQQQPAVFLYTIRDAFVIVIHLVTGASIFPSAGLSDTQV